MKKNKPLHLQQSIKPFNCLYGFGYTIYIMSLKRESREIPYKAITCNVVMTFAQATKNKKYLDKAVRFGDP